MVKVITITTEGDLVNAVITLNRIKKNLPRMTREVMRKWGGIVVKDTKNSAIEAGIQSSSNVLMSKGIRWEQGKRSDVGFMFIRLYGIYLDSMKPHFVSVTRRRSRLLSWAKRSRSPNIRRKARLVELKKIDSFGIYVKPHPFIRSGYAKARPKLTSMIRRSTKFAINAA